MWKNIGLAAAILLAIAAPAAIHAVSAAPEPGPATKSFAVQATADKSFVPTCKAGEVADSRPDPAWVGASFAHDDCWAPKAPAPIDGAVAKREQIVAGMEAAKDYAVAVNGYQACISKFLIAHKALAEKGQKPADMALITIENHRIAASQDDKKKVADRIKVAINAFNEYGSECAE